MKQPFIQESFSFEGSDVELVHSKTVEWMRHNDAKIVEDAPDRVRAFHEKHIAGIYARQWSKAFHWSHWNPIFWRKEIVVDLIPGEDSVEVVFSIFLTSDVNLLDHVCKRWWTLLLLDYMSHLEVNNTAYKSSFYSKETSKNMIKDMLLSPVMFEPVYMVIIFILLVKLNLGWISILPVIYGLRYVVPLSGWIYKVSKLTSN